ncbi:hypothetical protein G4B88_025575 [Cannabis sativa]|uniref:Uncharacterized protein n=1 Tax=Cannabis sativa TaxID=3483 RepID=A0A7J6F2J4_CANSA|nr:hypothetical protein G4B88_025575 [Cannabis sativa]
MAASTRISFPKADSSSSIRVSLKTNACAVSDLGFITSQLSGLKISKVVSFQPVRPIFTKFSPALQPVARTGLISEEDSNKLENTFNYDLGRVWAVGSIKGINQVVFGFDKGFCIVKIMKGGDSVLSGQT